MSSRIDSNDDVYSLLLESVTGCQAGFLCYGEAVLNVFNIRQTEGERGRIYRGTSHYVNGRPMTGSENVTVSGDGCLRLVPRLQ